MVEEEGKRVAFGRPTGARGTRGDRDLLGRGGQLLLGLALLTSSLISLSVLVLLVRLIAIL
jgi:hypothetical protein